MAIIETESLAQKTANAISEQVIRRILLPGDRLVETRIARQLGVSQGTVREALKLLDTQGMVHTEARRGTFVTQLNEDYVESLYDILTELYDLMLRKVMKNITVEDIKELQTVDKKIEACAKAKDGYGFGECMFEGISLDLRIAADPLLENTIKGLWTLKRWVEYEALVYRQDTLMESHKALSRTIELTIRRKMRSAVHEMRKYAEFEKQIAVKVMRLGSGLEPRSTQKRT